MLGIIYMVVRVLVSDFINFPLLPTCSRHEETWVQQSLLLSFRISQKKDKKFRNPNSRKETCNKKATFHVSFLFLKEDFKSREFCINYYFISPFLLLTQDQAGRPRLPWHRVSGTGFSRQPEAGIMPSCANRVRRY